jgi:hypothetical protein
MDKQRKKHVLHRENCIAKVRKSHTKSNGVVISLLGKYGFEWSVATEVGPVFLSITTFPNRELAEKEYKSLIKE